MAKKISSEQDLANKVDWMPVVVWLGADFGTRKRLRQKQEWPLLKSIRIWLKQHLNNTPPKGKLGLAIKYGH